MERVRRVERTDGDGVSQWRTLFSKQLRHTPDVASATPLLPPLFKAGPVATVRLQANPLLREEAGTVQVGIAVDGTGSFLRTVDGLALCTVAETPRLRWAILGRTPGGKSWTAFQSDGLVVEEFRIDLLARMMAFDAGEYEWR